MSCFRHDVLLPLVLALVFLPAARAQDAASGTDLPVTIDDTGTSLQIRCDGRDVATYVYQHDQVRRPFFAHVKAPSGTQLTRNFPPRESERSDHPDMHPGLWIAFGDLNGDDFWRNKGHVVHERFTVRPAGDRGRGSFTERKRYQRADGSAICYEDFRCRVNVLADGYLLEWDSTFFPPADIPCVFGDQEEMGLGIRVASPLAEISGGRITDSAGRSGATQVWSQSSQWCDYSGKIGDETLGITILCHPDNFRNSWMHARNYGLIAANAFGRRAMQKGEASRIVVEPGQTLRLRYGVFLHGPTPNLNAVLRTYSKLKE